jgi:hypothetical protein
MCMPRSIAWASKRYAESVCEAVLVAVPVSDHDERLLDTVYSLMVGDAETATARADNLNYNLTADKYDGLTRQRSKSGSR